MSRTKFTEQQQLLLRANPYTLRVTETTLSLSKEFKKLFYEEYQSGIVPREILKKHGYPTEVLGMQRICGIATCIKREYKHAGEFSDIHSSKQPAINGDYPTISDPMKRLQHQVEYLTQEVEFLKKISSIRNIGK